jgi:hypothetical protein
VVLSTSEANWIIFIWTMSGNMVVISLTVVTS